VSLTCSVHFDEASLVLRLAYYPGLNRGECLKAHGAHYGQEAVVAVVRGVSAYVACDYLIYPVDKRNIASRKIPERLGGEIIGERTVQNDSGSVLDEVVYRIPLSTNAE
jgi:ribosomal-protein-alanine N-acetyltransferase